MSISIKNVVDNVFSGKTVDKWNNISGTWLVQPDVEVYDVEVKDIYCSPKAPGHVSWASLRMEADNVLKLSFIEFSGEFTYPPSYNMFQGSGSPVKLMQKTLVSTDFGDTWKDTGFDEPFTAYYRRLPISLQDGSILQMITHESPDEKETFMLPVFEKSGIGSNFPFRYETRQRKRLMSGFRRSTDGGKTWEEYPLPGNLSSFYNLIMFKQLNDGTLIGVGAVSPDPRGGKLNPMDICLSESKDNGKTWANPIVIARASGILSICEYCEEVDFVETESGKFLFLARVHPLSPNLRGMPGTNVMQFFGTRKGPMKWSFKEPTVTTMPHSGLPIIKKTKDDILIYQGHSGVFFSMDSGKNWNKRFSIGTYYPDFLQLPDGRILSVTQMGGGDTAYPPKFDMKIQAVRFNYRCVGCMEQTDPKQTLAFNQLEGIQVKDCHIRLQLRHDGCTGIAFRVKAADEYYALYLQAPRSPERVLNHTQGHSEQTFLVLSYIKGDTSKLVATLDLGRIELFMWYELQLRAEGNCFTAAVKHTKNDSIFFMSAKDSKLTDGGLGLVTDLSTGAFADLTIWSNPQDIRKLWSSEQKNLWQTSSWDTLP